jgi:hypothetical protein
MQNQSHSTRQSQNSSNDILAEATTDSLNELMNRAPDVSDAEADRIIEFLRSQRAKFATLEASPKPKKTPRSKAPLLSADDILGAIDDL